MLITMSNKFSLQYSRWLSTYKNFETACVTFSVTFLRLDMDEYKGIFYEICFKCTQTTAPKTSYKKNWIN